jgi:hypothetical protein
MPTIGGTPPGVLSNFWQGAGELNAPPLGAAIHRRLVIYA